MIDEATQDDLAAVGRLIRSLKGAHGPDSADVLSLERVLALAFAAVSGLNKIEAREGGSPAVQMSARHLIALVRIDALAMAAQTVDGSPAVRPLINAIRNEINAALSLRPPAPEPR